MFLQVKSHRPDAYLSILEAFDKYIGMADYAISRVTREEIWHPYQLVCQITYQTSATPEQQENFLAAVTEKIR